MLLFNQEISPMHVYWDKDNGPINCPKQALTVARLRLFRITKTFLANCYLKMNCQHPADHNATVKFENVHEKQETAIY